MAGCGTVKEMREKGGSRSFNSSSHLSMSGSSSCIRFMGSWFEMGTLNRLLGFEGSSESIRGLAVLRDVGVMGADSVSSISVGSL